MRVSFKILQSCAISALALTGSLASAQTSGEDEIIVRGQYLYSNQVNALKTPTPIIDIPQSLSITTAEQIIAQGFDSIGDIVLYTPGLNQSQGEGHRDAVVFRGVRSTADFFIDGVRDDVQYYRSLYNLEQVEVLRGPNALLFGRGGTGGLINRVTKKGDLDQTFVGYKASVDTFGAFDVAADINYAINDQAAFRLNANYESLNNHRDFFDGDRFGINPTLHLEVAPATTVDLSYEFADHERFVDRGIPSFNDAPAFDLEDITFGDPENNFTTLEAHVFNATVQHQFSDNIKGNLTAFYGDYDKVYSNFFASDAFDAERNAVELDGYIDTTERERFLLSGNLVGEFETGSIGHTIVVGAEYIDTSSDQNRFNNVFDSNDDDQEFFLLDDGPALNFSNFVGTNADGILTTGGFTDLNDETLVSVEVFSAYIQDEIAINDYFDIVLGGRFDRFDIEVDNVDPDSSSFGVRTRVDEEFSPRVGLVFKPQENISLYGSFSESFLPRSGEQFTDINGDDDQLAPDTFQNLEAGVKWDFANGLSFTAAVFEIESTSPQQTDDEDEEVGILDVVTSDIQGFEAQLQGNITEQWYISAGYSYLDGNQVETDFDDNGIEFQFEGDRLRELPENTFNIWSNYQVTPKLGLGAGVTWQDESFAGNDASVVLPSFTRVDAAAYYDVSDDLRLQVNVENLFDEEYFPNAHTNNNITVGAPLNAKFTVSGRF